MKKTNNAFICVWFMLSYNVEIVRWSMRKISRLKKVNLFD